MTKDEKLCRLVIDLALRWFKDVYYRHQSAFDCKESEMRLLNALKELWEHRS